MQQVAPRSRPLPRSLDGTRAGCLALFRREKVPGTPPIAPHGIRLSYRDRVIIEYEEIDREVTPLGELVLRHYRAATGEEGYEILIDGAFLMASHGSYAERAMAGLAHARFDSGTGGAD